MTGPPLFIFIFFGVLVLATMIAAWIFTSKAIRESKSATHEKNDLKILYDQLRKEKFDLEDKLSQIQGQERTYKVAYEDWKSKYSLLEEKYHELKKDTELHSPEETALLNKEINLLEKVNETLKEEINDLNLRISNLSSNPAIVSTNSDSKIVSELKSVLDQHLAIISNIIGDEKMEQYTHKSIPADPLHLIKGIDPEISAKLQSSGIRTFEQIVHTSRRDLKKWMIDFEEIDDKLIESWPYQAEAILNMKAVNNQEN
jgi:seryl-tRNA synthetase